MLKLILGASIAATALLGAPMALAQSEPFVGQITPTAANFCPNGWARADGQLLAISSNDALFSLYGTTYGGDGQTTFGLPDLRGRMAAGAGTGPGLSTRRLGQKFGSDTMTLTVLNLASHNHSFLASTSPVNMPGLNGGSLGTFPPGSSPYAPDTNVTQVMRPGSIANSGNNFPVNVQQPFTTVFWCVALYGIYPSRN
jgi:microcystin-dependent protein